MTPADFHRPAAVNRYASPPKLLALLAVALTVCVGGCRQRPEPAASEVRSVKQRGPIRLTVRARPAQVWLGDPVEITVSAEAPEEYQLRLPEPEELSPLKVVQVQTTDPLPVEGGRKWQRRFVVETFSSGTLKVPALGIGYRRSAGPDSAPVAFDSELTADELPVEVRSALTSQDSVSRPRDITGTLTPARTLAEQARRVLLPVVGALAVLAAALLGWRRFRSRSRVSPPLLPEIRALQALAALEGCDWIGTGRAREFYYRLSEIVRHYIEEKFSLAAPEMTTEEFLTMLAQNRTALPYDFYRLREFLEACDIVKYAAFVPQRADAERVLAAARAFVHQTAAAAAQAAAQPREQAA
jgi:hypothetical protein